MTDLVSLMGFYEASTQYRSFNAENTVYFD